VVLREFSFQVIQITEVAELHHPCDMGNIKKKPPESSNNRPNISRSTRKRTSLNLKADTSTTSKSKRWNIPDGSTVDSYGNLITPSRGISKNNSVSSMISVESRNEAQVVKVQKIKPIIVDANFLTISNQLNQLNLSPKPLIKIMRNSEENSQTKIECPTLESKVEIVKMLQAKKFAFHTHAESGIRTKLFVLKNYFKEECDSLLLKIKEVCEGITKVSYLFEHSHRPIYLIHCNDQQITLQDLQRNLRAIDQVIVKWEKFDFRRKRPMPCRRCKMWGHSASNCYRQYRCIKCDQDHQPGECSRKDRTTGSPTCVNCGGDHPANSTICSSYINYIKSIQSRRTTRRPLGNNNQPIISFNFRSTHIFKGLRS
jgi:hypothetical protein